MALPFLRRLFSPASAPPVDITEGKTAKEKVEARFQSGLKLASGLGEAQDFSAAARCYREAAEQGYAPAQFSLGMLYAEGQGVPQDDAQAMLWIGRAAQQGNADAQFNLGLRLYRTIVRSRSEDLPESRIEAYKWLRLAAAQGYPNSRAVCNRMTLSMSRTEVAEGNQRAAAFLVKQPAASPVAS